MGCVCSRRKQLSSQLMLPSRSDLYEQMRLRQVAEADQQMEELQHRVWSELSENEVAAAVALQDRHFQEEREVLDHTKAQFG